MGTLIDGGNLSQAKNILGARRLQASISLAFRNLHRDLRFLDQIDQGDDLDEYANKIHRACGPFALFGATHLWQRLSSLEQQLRDRRLSSVPEMVERTRSIADATEFELRFQTGGAFARLWLTLQTKPDAHCGV